MRMTNAWLLPCFLAVCGLGILKAAPASVVVAQEEEEQQAKTLEPVKSVKPKAESDVRAHYLVTVTNDYIIEAYKNGVLVPDAQRQLVDEVFGATVEKITLEVRDGDWLVFHVVHNHLRWGGTKFFAVAGCLTQNKYGFVSDPASAQWSACDDPAQAADFVRLRDYGTKTRASAETNAWSEGMGRMRDAAGQSFNGKPLWGLAPSTWVKFLVEAPNPVVTPTKAEIKVYINKDK